MLKFSPGLALIGLQTTGPCVSMKIDKNCCYAELKVFLCVEAVTQLVVFTESNHNNLLSYTTRVEGKYCYMFMCSHIHGLVH